MAGVAGALLTQINQFVGLNVLGLEPSGDLLVMLILGGVGRLYGAFVGPVVYLIAQDYLAKQYPEYWYFGIGVLLILVVLFARGGILGLLTDQAPRNGCDAALETQKLCKSFGALTVAQNIDFRLEPGARHALIGPNGAGKTTFVNMLTGALAPSSGRIFLGGEDITQRAARRRACKRGLGRTFQINTLFRTCRCSTTWRSASPSGDGVARRMWRPPRRTGK